MGGRGRYSRQKSEQFSFLLEEERNEVANIIQDRKKKTGRGIGIGSGGTTVETELVTECACCGEKTVPIFSEFHECEICGWIDDPQQNLNPSNTVGHNSISLEVARKIFQTRSK